MASGSFVQSSFVGGELSRYAQGNTIDPSYKTALARCLNSMPISERSVVRRPGFRHVSPTRRGQPAKLIDLNVKDEALYNMEFTDGHLRFQNGPELLKEAEVISVTDISTAKPVVVTVATAHDWTTGNQIQFSVSDETSRKNLAPFLNRQFEIDVISSTSFRLLHPVTGEPIDGSIITWSGSSAIVSHVVDLETPYTGELWRTVRSVETDDLTMLLNHDVAPRKLIVTDLDADRPSFFELDTADFIDGPYLDAVENSIATPSAVDGVIDVLFSFAAYSAARAYREGDFVSNGGVNYQSLVNQNVGNTPASSPAYWTIVTPGEAVRPGGFTERDVGRLMRLHGGNTTWTWGKITALSTTGLIDPTTATRFNSGFVSPEQAFDGDTSETKANCAVATIGFSALVPKLGSSFASPQAVSSAVIYPSSDQGYASVYYIDGTTNFRDGSFMRAQLIGSQNGITETVLADSGYVSLDYGPITLLSNDAVTTWNHVYIKCIPLYYHDAPNEMRNVLLSDIRMLSPSGIAGSGVKVQILGDPLVNTTAITSWRLGLFGAEYGYPTCGCYTEGRLWLSGVVPNRIDGSKSNAELNFSPTAAAGTVADNNAINYTFNSSEKNTIYWMEPVKEGIICGTLKGEWLVDSTEQSGSLTPTTTKARRITAHGCANVLPVVTGMTTLFAQRHRKQLYEYLTDAYSGKFFGSSLSEKAKHITKPNVAELVYQQEQAPTVWVRMDDNTLAGMLYRRTSAYSSQPPDFNGWHRHEHGGEKEFVSVCVGASVGGDIDTLSVVTKDPRDGVHHIEILTDYPSEGDTIRSAWQVDDGTVPPAGVITSVSGNEGIRFHGLWHLERRKVAAMVCGLDCGDFTVENGSIFVPFSLSNALFTKSKVNALTINEEDYGELAVKIDAGAYTIPAVIGYNFVSQGQLVRPAEVDDGKWGQTGARNGPAFGKVRRVQEYAIHLEGAQGVYVGTTFTNLRLAQLRSPGNTAYAADELFSGIHGGNTDDPHSTEGMLCWEIRRPYPAAVLQLGGFLVTQDK